MASPNAPLPSQYNIHYHRHQGKSCKLSMFTLIHSYPINITTVDIARDPSSPDPKGKKIRPLQELGDGLCLRAEWQKQINFFGYILVTKPAHTAPLPCPVVAW